MPNSKRLDPGLYGLPKRTVLEQHQDGVALVMNRKSRILMADGRRILEKVALIRGADSTVSVVLKTPAPVCSKTARLLAEHDVRLLPLD